MKKMSSLELTSIPTHSYQLYQNQKFKVYTLLSPCGSLEHTLSAISIPVLYSEKMILPISTAW